MRQEKVRRKSQSWEQREGERKTERKKESLSQKPRGYPAIPECSAALTYFGISVSVFVSAAL